MRESIKDEGLNEEMVENVYLKLWKEDGILFGTFTEGIQIDLDIAKLCVAERIKFSRGKSYPCLIDMRGIKSVSSEAREHLATEGAKLITVSALITGNLFTRTLAHIFLTINKPKVPTRLFGDVNSAKQWLLSFVR